MTAPPKHPPQTARRAGRPQRIDVQLVVTREDLGVQTDQRGEPRRRADAKLDGEPNARIQARRP
jgi:hypothetical protein